MTRAAAVECSGEQDQSIKQRVGGQAVTRERERGINRAGTNVNVDGVDARAEQLEQGVQRPQSRGECIADATTVRVATNQLPS